MVIYLISNNSIETIETVIFCTVLFGGIWLTCLITLAKRLLNKKRKHENSEK